MNNIMESLDKLQFFGGQRAGRELWADKPEDVQNADIESFNSNIEFIRTYIQQLETKCHQLEWDRDAAVKDMRNSRHCCAFCKHDDGMYCKSIPKPLDNSCFEWRGVKED